MYYLSSWICARLWPRPHSRGTPLRHMLWRRYCNHKHPAKLMEAGAMPYACSASASESWRSILKVVSAIGIGASSMPILKRQCASKQRNESCTGWYIHLRAAQEDAKTCNAMNEQQIHQQDWTQARCTYRQQKHEEIGWKPASKPVSKRCRRKEVGALQWYVRNNDAQPTMGCLLVRDLSLHNRNLFSP